MKELLTEKLMVALEDALNESLDGALYCDRCWSAWGVGTMSEGDFSEFEVDEDVMDTVLKAIKPFLNASIILEEAVTELQEVKGEQSTD